MKITITPGPFVSNTNCPIARGLRRRGIFAQVGGFLWHGFLLGFIPVSGELSHQNVKDAMNMQDMPKGSKQQIDIHIRIGWKAYNTSTLDR